jgi:hypothetical protein
VSHTQRVRPPGIAESGYADSVKWFGQAWPDELDPAPVCSDPADQIPVPVGATCVLCTVLIDEGDRGVQFMNGPYAHAECNLRSVVGGPAHLDGTCSCFGGVEPEPSAQTYRQESIEVWNRVQTGRLR